MNYTIFETIDQKKIKRKLILVENEKTIYISATLFQQSTGLNVWSMVVVDAVNLLLQYLDFEHTFLDS